MVTETFWFVRAYLVLALVSALFHFRALLEAGPAQIALIVVGYIGAGLVAGVILGLMYPLRKWLIGRIAMGIVAGFGIGLALAPVALGDDTSFRQMLLIAAIFGVLLGPVGAIASWKTRSGAIGGG